MSQKSYATPRKLPQQDRFKFTVDAILTATAHVLIEAGYDKASTNRIAERAGISIGSLYQYFPIQAGRLEQEVSQMLLSYLAEKFAH